MNIVIIEDEPATARNLEYMLKEIEPDLKVLIKLTSISDSIGWLIDNQICDLIFMDIRLSDGLSFEIFKKVELETPVIFVTAYNEYALQAFKANGIDYVLKPFEEGELQNALTKFKKLKATSPLNNNGDIIKMLGQLKENSSFKQSFLIQYKDKLIPLQVNQIAWLYTENDLVHAQTFDKKQYIMDFTLEQLQTQLDSTVFFRANRQYLINRSSILEAEIYFNGRLLIKVQPQSKDQILISKARVPEFKQWMNR